MKNLYYISLILTIIGSLNWGLVGLADYNLVSAIFGSDNSITRFIYTLVGLSGINLLFCTLTDKTNTTSAV